MSRRRQLATREPEIRIKKHEASAPAGEPAPTSTPPKQGSVARIAMLLWGFPLILFIVVAVLKAQCGQ